MLHKNPNVQSAPAHFTATDTQIGTWECQLPFETLTWSDEVYEIFELPRGMPLTRSETLGFYTEESRAKLETIRAGAIEEQSTFSMDLEINTALGKQRWVRIHGEIEYQDGVPVRVFGTKQDITAEKTRG
jgi:PAS domain-containing protein